MADEAAADTPATFEAALRDLESVVARLESGDLDLESALRDFQRGIELVRFCAGKLDEAERRVEMLVAGAEGDPQTRPFPIDEGASA